MSPFDDFAIKTTDKNGCNNNLPIEISRNTKFIIERGVTVEATNTGDRHYTKGNVLVTL